MSVPKAGRIIEITIYSICCIIEICFGFLSIRELQSRSTIDPILRILFYISVGNASIITCAWLIGAFVWYKSERAFWIMAFIGAFAFILQFVVIYCTLVWRLNNTFKGTIYAPSKSKKIGFGIILFLLITLPMPFLHLFIRFGTYEEMERWKYAMFFWWLCVIWAFLYLICAALAVHSFRTNLVSLAKAQAGSMYNGNSFKLNYRQKMMVAVASYVAIYSQAF